MNKGNISEDLKQRIIQCINECENSWKHELDKEVGELLTDTSNYPKQTQLIISLLYGHGEKLPYKIDIDAEWSQIRVVLMRIFKYIYKHTFSAIRYVSYYCILETVLDDTPNDLGIHKRVFHMKHNKEVLIYQENFLSYSSNSSNFLSIANIIATSVENFEPKHNTACIENCLHIVCDELSRKVCLYQTEAVKAWNNSFVSEQDTLTWLLLYVILDCNLQICRFIVERISEYKKWKPTPNDRKEWMRGISAWLRNADKIRKRNPSIEENGSCIDEIAKDLIQCCSIPNNFEELMPLFINGEVTESELILMNTLDCKFEHLEDKMRKDLKSSLSECIEQAQKLESFQLLLKYIKSIHSKIISESSNKIMQSIPVSKDLEKYKELFYEWCNELNLSAKNPMAFLSSLSTSFLIRNSKKNIHGRKTESNMSSINLPVSFSEHFFGILQLAFSNYGPFLYRESPPCFMQEPIIYPLYDECMEVISMMNRYMEWTTKKYCLDKSKANRYILLRRKDGCEERLLDLFQKYLNSAEPQEAEDLQTLRKNGTICAKSCGIRELLDVIHEEEQNIDNNAITIAFAPAYLYAAFTKTTNFFKKENPKIPTKESQTLSNLSKMPGISNSNVIKKHTARYEFFISLEQYCKDELVLQDRSTKRECHFEKIYDKELTMAMFLRMTPYPNPSDSTQKTSITWPKHPVLRGAVKHFEQCFTPNFYSLPIIGESFHKSEYNYQERAIFDICAEAVQQKMLEIIQEEDQFNSDILSIYQQNILQYSPNVSTKKTMETTWEKIYKDYLTEEVICYIQDKMNILDNQKDFLRYICQIALHKIFWNKVKGNILFESMNDLFSIIYDLVVIRRKMTQSEYIQYFKKHKKESTNIRYWEYYCTLKKCKLPE